jgi:hypothetical protein
MEKIVRFGLLIMMMVTSFCCKAQVNDITEVTTVFGRNQISTYYNNEEPNLQREFTVDPTVVGFNMNKLNILFYSEVQDEFLFYINGNLVETKSINTKKDEENKGRIDIVTIDFPSGASTATLKVTSLNYGGLETTIKKEFPMLYLKKSEKGWSAVHNAVYRLPGFYFSRSRQ